MKGLKIFNNERFGKVRTVLIDDKVMFVANDVAKALGYKKPNNAINDHCRYTLKQGIPHPQSKTKTIDVIVIPEGDVVRLAAKCQLDGAVEFESWIFDEVIPRVMKTGGYIGNSDLMVNTYFGTLDDGTKQLIKGLFDNIENQQKLILEKDEIIEEQKPKVELADRIVTSDGLVNLGEVAKLFNERAGKTVIGRNKLCTILRDEQVLMTFGVEKNNPQQRYINSGYFKLKTSTYDNGYGTQKISSTTKVTPKGIEWLWKFLIKKDYIKTQAS
ncbi:MAG: hypothetical protein GY714_23450 [Desulfobacterales bacterium]|nr:hypothetical protein [Desulfobacterales bacterium]